MTKNSIGARLHASKMLKQVTHDKNTSVKPRFIFLVILNLFQDLTSEEKDIQLNRLFYAWLHAGKMLKRVQHDKKIQLAQGYTPGKMLKQVTHDKKQIILTNKTQVCKSASL